MKVSKLCLALSLFTADLSQSFAEPWLSNRFAQNCSACHAPARRNLPASERRCTLTCQGCHINPSGGGMRSAYGKWTQSRWLRSIPKTVFQRSAASPAPLAGQAYANQPRGAAGLAPADGYDLAVAQQFVLDGVDYSRADGQELITVQSQEEFLERIPKGDPYRTARQRTFMVGIDYRYIHEEVLAPQQSRTTYSWPMSLDLGFNYSAIPQKLDFVYEARFMQRPRGNDPISDHGKLVSGGLPYMRAAYGLWHNLPYNTYVTAGVYRPLFGYMIPDHTALSQTMAGFDQFTRHGAFTLGAAPNVPFINIHGILPYQEGEYGEASRGFAANLGGRFVTLGASIMASYWHTTDKPGEEQLERRLGSLNMGFQLGEASLIFDYLGIRRQTFADTWARGSVYTFDMKYRFYRQHYLAGRYEESPDLTSLLDEGSARYQSLGFKSYWYAGLETELLYRLRSQQEDGEDKRLARYIQLMVHVFL